MEITWDASFETGNELIDRQHRQILELVDQLTEAELESHDEVLRALDAVMDFTLDHFHAEENVMRQVQYPAEPTKEMVDEHDEFKSYARLRVLEFRKGEWTAVKPLQDFLADWLTTHEFGLDLLLVNWIRAQAASPS